MKTTKILDMHREPTLAQLRALIEQASDGIFVADVEGRYTFVNEAGCRLLGYARDELIGTSITDLIPPEDVDRLLKMKERFLAGASDVSEWKLRRKDGQWQPVEVSAKILADGQWQGIVRDISDRVAHQAERDALFQQVTAQERWLRAVLDALPLGVVLYRTSGETLYNRRAEELVGLKLSPTGGSAQYSSRIFYRDGRPVPRSELVSTRVMQNEETIVGEEFLIERPDGARIPILGSAAPIRDDAGRMIGGVGVFQDVSERMRAEEIIREEQRLLKAIFDILPVGIWIADRSGKIVSNNPAGERIWRGARYVPVAEFGQYKGWWVENGKPIAAEEWALARALTQGTISLGELVRIQCFDGSFKTIINSAAPLRDEQGAITGAIVVNEDVTSLQHVQEQLRAAVRDRENILATVTHDLRSPLSAVMITAQAAERIARSMAGGETICAMATSLYETARRMSGLVDDLLAVTVSQDHSILKLAPVAANILLAKAADAARPLFTQRSLGLQIKVTDQLPLLSVDSDRILRVFANLLDNALKFTSPPGRVLLSAETVAGGVRFSVANSGEALPLKNLDGMFQQFWQADRDDRRGAGLGLAICRSIIEAHGGSLWAEPAQGERVRVCFILPRAPATKT